MRHSILWYDDSPSLREVKVAAVSAILIFFKDGERLYILNYPKYILSYLYLPIKKGGRRNRATPKPTHFLSQPTDHISTYAPPTPITYYGVSAVLKNSEFISSSSYFRKFLHRAPKTWIMIAFMKSSCTWLYMAYLLMRYPLVGNTALCKSL